MEFFRPIGAASDVKGKLEIDVYSISISTPGLIDSVVSISGELEYISALHQTVMPNIRVDASIKGTLNVLYILSLLSFALCFCFLGDSDEDIVSFLASKYGIRVNKEYVRSTVLKGVGGGAAEDDCIDLMELMSIILIPALIKAANQVKNQDPNDSDMVRAVEEGVPLEAKAQTEANVKNKVGVTSDEFLQPPDGLLQFVVGMILHDATGSMQPAVLDKKLLSFILKAYGEVELSEDDDLLEEMVLCAVGPGGVLDVQSFARALTHDVQLYDLSKESTQTSRLSDAMASLTKSDAVGKSQRCCCFGFCQCNCKPSSLNENVEKFHTAETIDYVADAAGSKILPVFVWSSFIIFFFLNQDMLKIPSSCSPMSDEKLSQDFGCQVQEQLIYWFARVIIIA